MKVDSKELSDYFKAIAQSMKDGHEPGFLVPEVNVKLTVSHKKVKDGELKLFIVEAGGEVKSEEISTIEFKVENIFAHKYRESPSSVSLPDYMKEKK